ncbi:MAG: ribonuclease III domain-containing protein [Bacillota bacterium]
MNRLFEGLLGRVRDEGADVRAGGKRLAPEELPVLTLAYLGDAVHGLWVRRRLVAQGPGRPRELHLKEAARVSAGPQAQALARVWAWLSEAERAVARRGRNAETSHVPKGATHAEYAASTAWETLLGHLCYTEAWDRLAQVLTASEGDGGGDVPW